MLLVGLTGCDAQRTGTGASGLGEPQVSADATKRQMVEAVNDATERLDGKWKARTGPDYAEDCALADGEAGAQWRYLTGSTTTGEPDADATAMAAHWEAQGMQVVRRDSSDGPAVFADGGRNVSSISVYAYAGNYTVQAVSLCFPGDADEL